MNIYQRRFGDTMIGAAILREFKRRIQAVAGDVEIDLLQHTDNPEAELLIAQARVSTRVVHLPCPAAQLRSYDIVFDMSDGRQGTGVSLMDDGLRRLGLDPATVDRAARRMRLEVDPARSAKFQELLAPMLATGKPLVLFHPLASTEARSMPRELVGPFAESLAESMDAIIVIAEQSDYRSARVNNLSHFVECFDDLVAIISHMNAFVSVDTCVYHVADALNIPGVVLFTLVEPMQRIADYPFIEGLAMWKGSNPLLGKHGATDPADLEYVRGMWRDMNVIGIKRALCRAIASRTDSRHRVRPGVS